MKVISTYTHGILDYVVGIALILAPNLFGFAEVGGAAVNVPRILGILILLQSVVTDYELSLFKILPMRTHLMMDYLAFLVLAASPFIFGFNEGPANQWTPHLMVGLIGLIATACTETEPRRVAVTRSHGMP